jgi:hypothetical protein
MGVRRVSGQDPGLNRKRSDMPIDTENVCCPEARSSRCVRSSIC